MRQLVLRVSLKRQGSLSKAQCSRMGSWVVHTCSLKMKARMAAESSTRKMIRINRKNCREREGGAAVRPTWAPSYRTPYVIDGVH